MRKLAVSWDVDPDALQEACYSKLTERERIVVGLRFGTVLDANVPQGEIATLIGIPVARVQKIEAQAVGKLWAAARTTE